MYKTIIIINKTENNIIYYLIENDNYFIICEPLNFFFNNFY